MTDDPEQQVGSVAEEAAALLTALSGLARDHEGAAVDGLAEAARQARRGFNDHLATGAAECSWCPVCQVVHAVRTTSPEVKDQLKVAAHAVLRAASAALATATPTPRSGTPVERIDLDGAEGGEAESGAAMGDGDRSPTSPGESTAPVDGPEFDRVEVEE